MRTVLAQREPEIKPPRVLDDGGRELVAGVRDRQHPRTLSPWPDRHGQQTATVPVTMPSVEFREKKAPVP